ncbi:putative TBC domain protein [Aspergillus clavatus NRRL 1]|uniref:TBC domain protein, putative n=1 Tax=Aspergillus clavatus (strain ATCC 1007 / CBS 513.65 / DSM 816 / NCTC 3887 / NRRL 1 / QM 1276 / 107) TaxID=344612 RepID=A1CKZ1_ASPCL|nr:TBC domain protein, putative [Aspergillus clavatus NRRL 1]EAW09815.1 TBC domain protein, putative [Aspergillus clavatus NRRL 1]
MADKRSSSVPTVVMTEALSPFHALRYEDTVAATASGATRSTSLSTPHGYTLGAENNPASTSASSDDAGGKSDLAALASRRNDSADSGLAPSPSIATEKRLTPPADDYSAVSIRSLRSIPSITVNDASARPVSRPGSRWSERKWSELRGKLSGEFDRRPESPPPVPQIETPFNKISLDIPTGSLEGLGTQSMRFSKRGSLIKHEARQRQQQQQQQQQEYEEEKEQQVQQQGLELAPPIPEDQEQPTSEEKGEGSVSRVSTDQNSAETDVCGTQRRRVKPPSYLRARTSSIPSRAISADEDMLSRRVRLMYEKGDENVTDSEVAKSLALENGVLWEEVAPTSTEISAVSGPSASGASAGGSSIEPDSSPCALAREPNELAGGIEYWQNIKAGDVDRYGFIRTTTQNSGDGTDHNPLQRVSTSLLLASETPRRKHSIRPTSTLAGNRPFSGRSPTRKSSAPTMRPSSSQSTYSSNLRRSTSRFRQAANHLPHNRNRRFKDEAADMLTLPANVVAAGAGRDSSAARAMRKKEWEREDKWTKMARPTRRSRLGGGMTFEFDTQSSKLIERTWKGIPDRWRATAWYAFLEASAKRRSDSPTEEALIEAFNEFQFISSPDDVQIDIDVPRTITSHIMFRRRYRGGQRLLFRVLHAMSLYFPDTGYVQGMAALAATLLAYYDEEHAFIMLVRLWQLRGLERLYQSGFSGLLEALGDFEREWLDAGEVAAKLNELGIPPTAYGTRWYLTLFNYSIPFPAQLRVWDVFMLLGDAEDPPGKGTAATTTTTTTTTNPDPQGTSAFGRGLDILHATSAALIDGMREIILESDFENAMKVLTSWVPIQDVELFMRVAKAEWKVHRRKRGG